MGFFNFISLFKLYYLFLFFPLQKDIRQRIINQSLCPSQLHSKLNKVASMGIITKVYIPLNNTPN